MWVNVLVIVTSVSHFHREQNFVEEHKRSDAAGWLFTISLIGGVFGLFAYLAWYWALAVAFVCAAAGGVLSVFMTTLTRYVRWVGPISLLGAWAIAYAQM